MAKIDVDWCSVCGKEITIAYGMYGDYSGVYITCCKEEDDLVARAFRLKEKTSVKEIMQKVHD